MLLVEIVIFKTKKKYTFPILFVMLRRLYKKRVNGLEYLLHQIIWIG